MFLKNHTKNKKIYITLNLGWEQPPLPVVKQPSFQSTRRRSTVIQKPAAAQKFSKSIISKRLERLFITAA